MYRLSQPKKFGLGRSVAVLEKITNRPSYESVLRSESSFGPAPPAVRLARVVVRAAISRSDERKNTKSFAPLLETARLWPFTTRPGSTARGGVIGISPLPSLKTRA